MLSRITLSHITNVRRSAWHRWLAVGAALFLLSATPHRPALASAAQFKTWVDTDKRNALRVLFIGNSITYWNQLPLMLSTMLNAQQPNFDMKISEAIGDNFTLEEHWKDGTALRAIKEEGPWTYVVLQEQSMRPLADARSFAFYTRLFDRAIKSAGSRTLLFETYVDDDDLGYQPKISSLYRSMANELHDSVLPIGTVWRQVRASLPQVDIYAPDRHHPGPIGSYLMACVCSSKFLGRSPVGAPGHLTIWELDQQREVPIIDIQSNVARQLQACAWNAVRVER